MTYNDGTQQDWDAMSSGVKKLNDCVSEIRGQIKIGMNVVSDLQRSWRDRAQEAFVEEMSQKANEVEDLMQKIEQYAKAVDEYITQTQSNVNTTGQRIRSIG